MRIVVDTNVYISALVFNKTIQELLNSLLEQHTILISEFITNELSRKLISKFNLNSQEVDVLIRQLLSITLKITPIGNAPQVARDNDDNQILHLAEFANADLIISGDKDLLSLVSYKSIPILKPSDLFS